MLIDFSKLADGQSYFTLIQLVVPRPIAWILTDNGDGSHNLAPYSFFNAVCGEPPMVIVGIGRRDDGSAKDTRRNTGQRPDFVVHLPSGTHASAMVRTSAALPPGESEVAHGGLEVVPVEGWPLPRIAVAPVALLCRRDRLIDVGTGPTSLLLAEVLQAWVKPAAVRENNGRLVIDPVELDPIARLGGTLYSRLGAVESHPRP